MHCITVRWHSSQPCIRFRTHLSTVSFCTPCAAVSRQPPAYVPYKTCGCHAPDAGTSNVYPRAYVSTIDCAAELLDVLRVSVETRKTQLVDAALDCVQRLISHGILSGPVQSINHRREAASKAAGPKKKQADDDEEDPAAQGPMPPQVHTSLATSSHCCTLAMAHRLSQQQCSCCVLHKATGIGLHCELNAQGFVHTQQIASILLLQ